jgi:hypothetical protein
LLCYNLVNLLLLDRRCLVRGCSGCSILLFTFRTDCEEAESCSMRYYLATLFRWDNSWNYLWYFVEMTPQSNNDTMGSRLIKTWRFHIYGWTKRTSQTSSGETSHNTSSLKGWMSYGNRNYWLTRRSRPWRSHPMLYGCGCGVVDNLNCLMTSVEMRFF